jgi:predicted transcriptional regulator
MKQPISARLDFDLLNKAKQIAKKENRSFNNLLETSLKQYCENQ